MKKLKEELKYGKKGITLISLVVTIIVLLILAGVTIATLTGENGILTQAQKAKEETENAAKQEEQDLVKLEAMINGEDIVIVPVDDDNPGELEQEGTDTFVINSIEDLVFFSYDVTTNGTTYEGKTVKLGTNLDFNSDKSYVNPNRTDFDKYGYNGPLKQALTTGTGFSPIGELLSTGTNYFYGTFDGNNNAICSMYINIDRDENIRTGLFSTCYGEIRNLGLVNANITVKGIFPMVGGIAGASYNNIYNSYTTGNIDATGNSWMDVGGICGLMQKEANIENCYNLANINATNIKEETGGADISCGGIIGKTSSNIDKCYNKGNILGNGGVNSLYIGGICGTSNEGEIKNCYNNANLEGVNGILEGDNYTVMGGIIGYSKTSNIENCYNSGEIIENSKTNSMTGGIIGSQSSASEITNVFNMGKIDINYSNITSLGGIMGLRGGSVNINIINAYNTGKIEANNIDLNSNRGAITGTNVLDLITFDNCCYLESSYDIGVRYGSSTGITALDSIEDFPSLLSVVNGEGAFKEDTEGINNGYPILQWQ